jgi:hypothetical protein
MYTHVSKCKNDKRRKKKKEYYFLNNSHGSGGIVIEMEMVPPFLYLPKLFSNLS